MGLPGRAQLGRRGFLGWGATLLGSALLPHAGLAHGLGEFLDGERLVLETGYHPGGEGLWSPVPRAAADVALRAADQVRVTVHGLYGAALGPACRALRLTALFLERPDRAFHAWCYKRGPIPSLSGRSAFPYPISPDHGVSLQVAVDLEGPDGEGRTLELPLRLGLDRGPALRHGFYALALVPPGLRHTPRWRQHVGQPADPREHATGSLVRATALGTEPARFPYLLIEIGPEAVEAPAV